MDQDENDPPTPAPITDFRGEHRWLSNFYLRPVYLNFPACDETVYRHIPGTSQDEVVEEPRPYASTEHAYQAAKTLSPEWRERVRNCATPSDAKKCGRALPMRPDWERDVTYHSEWSHLAKRIEKRSAPFKVLVMLELLRQKFPVMLGDELTERLLGTYPRDLVEGNYWRDVFWGQCPLGTGENWLGRLLVMRRGEIVTSLQDIADTRRRGEVHYECDCLPCRAQRRLREMGV